MEDILIKTDERELEGLREKRENSSGNSRVTEDLELSLMNVYTRVR